MGRQWHGFTNADDHGHVPGACACSPVRHLEVNQELGELLSTSADGVLVWDMKVRISNQVALGPDCAPAVNRVVLPLDTLDKQSVCIRPHRRSSAGSGRWAVDPTER